MHKRVIDVEDAPLGMGDFLGWIQDKTTNWGWIAVRAPLEVVCQAYQENNWQVINQVEMEIGVTPHFNFSDRQVSAVELVGHGYEWLLVMRAWGDYDRDKIAKEAKWLSDRLKTKVLGMGYDQEIYYELWEWGSRLELATLGKTFTFDSQLRPIPSVEFSDRSINGRFMAFVDATIGELRIYVPACWAVARDEKCILVTDPRSQYLIGNVRVLQN